MKNIIFKKSGLEIKAAIKTRCQELKERLDRRNAVLEEILDDRNKVRSYMLRQSGGNRYEYQDPPIVTKTDIPSEEIEEITQMCKRINQLEQEIKKLELTENHLSDDEVFELELRELIRYGFHIE